MLKFIFFLVVDDDEATANLLKKGLSSPNRVIKTVGNGDEAMVVLSKEKFDILITDIFHEGLSGLDMISRIRTNPKLQDLRILIVSGQAYGQRAEEAWKRGADGVLCKPFDIQELEELIRGILA